MPASWLLEDATGPETFWLYNCRVRHLTVLLLLLLHRFLEQRRAVGAESNRWSWQCVKPDTENKIRGELVASKRVNFLPLSLHFEYMV